jgi:endo-1,4-beta-D-glucanase Y
MITTLASAQGINSGNPARPFGANKAYAYGLLPTNLPTSGTYGSATAAATAYTNWINDFVENCSDGSKRVKFDQVQYTVSEGIGYGMLLSAYAGDRVTFDGLWNYYKKFRNNHGVMHWKIDGCNATNQSNGATDAELDVAMALIVASKQWTSGTYLNDAHALIQIIKTYEMESDGDTKPGDAWNSAKNPSYYAPAYYREYAKVDTENAAFWNKAVTVAEAHLLTNRHATTGLVSNWSVKGGAVNTSRGEDGKCYGYESIRNPWRMATDYAWNGPNVAKAGQDICTKVSAFMVGREANIRILMYQNGGAVTSNNWKNGVAYMTALAAIGGSNQASLNSLYTNANAQNGRINNSGDNSNYFSATLRCITLFMMTGNFWNPSDNVFPRTETMAIDFVNTQPTIVVYPSPAKNVLHVESAQQMRTIHIFNTMGVSALLISTNSQHETIDVSTLSHGTYLVRVEYADGSVENSRFIKN